MAGFFAALIVGRRGAAAFVRDRARRILLVLVVALYPMKFVLGSLWMIGGRKTGWLAQALPLEVASLPWYVLGIGGIVRESWPDISLTHLWFLYYLACVSGVFVAALAAGRPRRIRSAPAACRRRFPARRLQPARATDVPGTSLTMMLSVFGWLGLFVRFFNQPSARIRYVADASYWIYVTHLPLVVVLQIWWADSGMPWWIQMPLVNVVAFAVLLASYHVCVRFMWVGAWLNGRRWLRSGENVEAAVSHART